MAVFEKAEMEERLLGLMKEIRASAVAVKDTVDRHETTWSKLRGELFDLLTSIKKLSDIAGYLPEGVLEEKESGIRSLKDSTARWSRTVEEVATQNIDPKYMEFPYQVELSIMGVSSSIIETLDFYLPVLEKDLNRSFGSNLTLVQDFVLSYPEYFNGNWAIAVVHLSAMEVVVNRKREEFGLTKAQATDSGDGFYKEYAELREHLLKKRVDIESELHSKADVLWNIRNKVMRNGMKLDDESLKLIIKWSRAVIDSLAETKP